MFITSKKVVVEDCCIEDTGNDYSKTLDIRTRIRIEDDSIISIPSTYTTQKGEYAAIEIYNAPHEYMPSNTKVNLELRRNHIRNNQGPPLGYNIGFGGRQNLDFESIVTKLICR